MNWLVTLEVFYFIIVFLVIARVLYDTRSGAKALAYILFIIMVPLVGMLFYFFFGINYRKRKLYSRKIVENEVLHQKIITGVQDYSKQVLQSGLMSSEHHNLSRFIYNSATSPLTANNTVQILLNGEEKFPLLLDALEAATSHIHLEYYIYEDNERGAP